MGKRNKKRKIAEIEVRVQNQQLPFGFILDVEQRRRRECLNLAIKLRVPLSFAIENYYILSEQLQFENYLTNWSKSKKASFSE